MTLAIEQPYICWRCNRADWNHTWTNAATKNNSHICKSCKAFIDNDERFNPYDGDNYEDECTHLEFDVFLYNPSNETWPCVASNVTPYYEYPSVTRNAVEGWLAANEGCRVAFSNTAEPRYISATCVGCGGEIDAEIVDE